ncbi:MAG: site-2 protease family protein [Thermoleophilia bacterium]|nr:site-2 protease family protein [Thermoleophilia bacterium]
MLQFAVTLPALILSLVFHEISHGYIALRLGDRTAQSRGRLSLNPIRHLDTFGTLVLFLTYFSSAGQMLFGWAKPVPINPAYFKNPQRGMAWVGVAGPTANFMLAAASAIILENWLQTGLLASVIFRVFQLNIIIMLFNLIPVPPLDGSRILGAFLGKKAYLRWIRLDQYGMIFIMLLLFLLVSFPGPLFEVILSLYRVFLPSFGF